MIIYFLMSALCILADESGDDLNDLVLHTHGIGAVMRNVLGTNIWFAIRNGHQSEFAKRKANPIGIYRRRRGTVCEILLYWTPEENGYECRAPQVDNRAYNTRTSRSRKQPKPS